MSGAPAFIPPGVRVAALHVEIVRYTGKNGGYATRMVEMWLPRLVSASGKRVRCDTTMYGGFRERHTAERIAAWWAQFLGGVPVVWRTGCASPDGHEPLEKHLIPDEDAP